MSYLLDRKAKKKRFGRIGIGLVLFLFLFYFRSGVYRGLAYVSSIIFHPVLVAGNNLGAKFNDLSAYFSFKSSLVSENNNLKIKLDEQIAQMSNYKTLEDENTQMKDILGRKNAKSTMVLAAILSKPNSSPYDTLVIDIGIDQNINIDDVVYAYGNVPIGRVADVYPSYSKVILFSSPGESTEATIGNIFTEIIGRGGGNFEMIMPRGLSIEKGAEAVLPGTIPHTIGIVQTIVSDPRDAYEKALLISPVNIQDLKFVEIDVSGN